VTPGRFATLITLLAGLLAGCVSLPTREELASMPAPHAWMPPGSSVVDGRARFRTIFCGVLASEPDAHDRYPECSDWLWQLSDEQPPDRQTLPRPDKTPQIYLVTGAFSECLSDETHPFRDAVEPLAESGYRIATIVVGGRSGIEHNAQQIADRLAGAPPGEAGPAVLIGHSKGTNDILEFLVRYPELAARVKSVVSVAGAVAGSPLADEAAGAYDLLFGWIPLDRCAQGDGGVIDSLRPEVRRDWLTSNPLPTDIRYFSLAAFTTKAHMAHSLEPAWKLLLNYDARNDGQVLASDALIPGATLLGYLNADHWSAAISMESGHSVLGARQDPTPFPRAALLEAILLQIAEPPASGRE
jgi:pimeloyl-ACP methyl ester carboxylesterase